MEQPKLQQTTRVNPSAIVVGGGLAGMVVARELALRRWRVILLERSKRLGGKAGSDIKNGRLVEHGYHVFPQWYTNIRTIVARIGVRLIDFDRYHFLVPGGYPRRITVRGPSSLSAMWHNIFNGLLPWYHNVLYIYSVLDMISRPISEKSFLDRVSQIGLMRGKWFTSESVAELGQENVLKASAIPVYDLSAMTAKRISTYWIRQASPLLSILPGDLQTVFIDPQVREIEALGVEIRYDSDVCGVVMREGAVAAVTLNRQRVLHPSERRHSDEQARSRRQHVGINHILARRDIRQQLNPLILFERPGLDQDYRFIAFRDVGNREASFRKARRGGSRDRIVPQSVQHGHQGYSERLPKDRLRRDRANGRPR